jgi:hypothetical protein
VPFHPRPDGDAGRAEPRSARRFLQSRLPDGWRFAHRMATGLARDVRHLSWCDRAEVLDGHFLHQAEAMLRAETLRQLVGGEPEALRGLSPTPEAAAKTARFATWSRAILTAVLLELDESITVSEPEQALTFLLSQHSRFAKAVARWSVENDVRTVEAFLIGYPGYALVFLAASPSDTARRFMARDAFWTAAVGRV